MDVTIDRDKYIGGSDEPAIMGISHFKTRWELLQEKAHPENVVPFTNEYVEYGNAMEDSIRKHVSENLDADFEPDVAFKGHVRYHADGFDGERVLEIKTTSQIHEDVYGYKAYLVQLLIGMWSHDVENGVLAVYERGDLEFDPFRLQTFEININDFRDLLDEVLVANDSFWLDLEYLKENPLATETELPSTTGLAPIINDIVKWEVSLAAMKELEERCKAAKAELYEKMTEHGIKGIKSIEGVNFTRIAQGEDKTEEVFDEDRFKAEHPDEWAKYKKTIVRKGKAGHVRVTGLKNLRAAGD